MEKEKPNPKIPDYTKWQRDYFDRMKPGEFSAEALVYAKAHPYKGKGKRL